MSLDRIKVLLLLSLFALVNMKERLLKDKEERNKELLEHIRTLELEKRGLADEAEFNKQKVLEYKKEIDKYLAVEFWVESLFIKLFLFQPDRFGWRA